MPQTLIGVEQKIECFELSLIAISVGQQQFNKKKHIFDTFTSACMLVCLIYLVWILKKGVLCIRLKHGKTGQTCFEEFAKDKKKRKKSPSHSPSLCAAAAAARHGSSEQRCDFIFRITAASLNVTRRLWIRLSSSKTAHPAACCANPGRKVVQRM